MKAKISLIVSGAALALSAVPAAWAGVHVSVGINPFGVVTGPPPPVVYAPDPVYAPPPVVYVGGGYWGGGYRGGPVRRGWHHDHHGH